MLLETLARVRHPQRHYAILHRTRRAAKPRAPAAPLATVAMGWAAPVDEAVRLRVLEVPVLAPTNADRVDEVVVAATWAVVAALVWVAGVEMGEDVREPPTTLE